MLRKLNLSLKDIAELFNLDKLYDDGESNSDEKADIIKKSEGILKKAYNELLETEKQIEASKKLLERSINKIMENIRSVK